MQREFIRYNRKVLGKPEIFGSVVRYWWVKGGSEEQENRDDKDEGIDKEEEYDDIEEEQSGFVSSSVYWIDIDINQDKCNSKVEGETNQDEQDEIDPLDLYMQEIDAKLKQEAANRVNGKVWRTKCIESGESGNNGGGRHGL